MHWPVAEPAFFTRFEVFGHCISFIVGLWTGMDNFILICS